jgi:hypothetical protein
MINEACGDLDDMAAASLLHLGDGKLRHMEEAGRVDSTDRGEIALAILGEGLGNVNASVVDERVDVPEPRDPFEDRAFCGLPIGDVAGD